MNDSYITVIGLETHVELATRTKIFCGCDASFGAPANTHVCPVCMGMPGALPVLNTQVVRLAVVVGQALNCKINRTCRFDRKNYFYPDNPQNYQISQLYVPIAVDGYVDISDRLALRGPDRSQGSPESAAPEEKGDAPRMRVRIHEMHMEEDAGKLIHDIGESKEGTFIDFNRAGVPLIEIVTEPDMHFSGEVIAYLEKLKSTIQYLEASDCRMNEGSLRVDVNLSVHKEGEPLGTRTEMKNLNSFKAIERAIANERERQIALLEAGEAVVQETRRWDDERGESYSMRSKEDAKDYRYFPDPDLPPVHITEETLAGIWSERPEFAEEKAARFLEKYGLPEYDTRILTSSKMMAELLDRSVECGADPKKAANWLMGETMRLMNEKGLEPEDLVLAPEDLAELIALTEDHTLNSTTAKEVFGVIFEEKTDVRQYVREHGLAMIRGEDELERIVDEVIRENPKSVEDYRAGKKKVIGFLVGQTMKKTKGQADPEAVNRLLIDKL